MAHRFISAVMLVLLILQGMTLAAADVLPAESTHSMAHCAGHDDAGADCACCGGADMMGVGCAAQCSAAVSISPIPIVLSIEPGANVPGLAHVWTAGPSYCPLVPPPIA